MMANQVVYGFHTLQQQFGALVTTLPTATIDTAITQAFAEHNRQLDLLRGLFVRPGITEAKRTFRTPQATRNQPLDEAGRAVPIRGAARYEVGFPLQESGQAIGWTWKHAQAQRVEDLNDTIRTILDGDASWVFDHILAALFNNADRAFWDTEFGNVTAKPIANGDGQVYQVPNGGFTGSTDNHLLAQANAIANGADDPFPAIWAELTEHPENGGTAGEVIVFIPTNLKASVTSLANFYVPFNPNITPGSGVTTLTGTLGVATPGTVLGSHTSGPWVVEWPRLPSNYMVAIHTGGEPPIGERVSQVPSIRGFIQTDTNQDFPWYQRNWMRENGYAAWNRVAALVYRVGNGSYAVPTNYSTIMP